MRIFWVSCLIYLFSPFSGSFAQPIGPPTWNQNPNTLQQYMGPPYTVEDLQAKISQAKLPPPDKESLLLREMERVDADIANATLGRSQANGWKDAKNSYEQIIARITKLSAAIAAFDCAKNPQRYYDLAASYSNEYQLLSQYVFSLGMDVSVIDAIRLAAVASSDALQVCNLTKEKFSAQEFLDGLKDVSATLLKTTSEMSANNEQLADAYSDYIKALQARRSAIQDKLNATQSAIQIGGNLPLLLLILGTACVSTILGIKLFDKDIQMEWVASGQVIQFVTVMILLSVILALGLSSTLKENTLGTLLGGLAGYVLAQGVGKSAAREATRSAADLAQLTASAPTAIAVLPHRGQPGPAVQPPAAEQPAPPLGPAG
jgi:hypothetical protein